MFKKLVATLIIMTSIMATGVVSFPGHASATIDAGCKTGSVFGSAFPTWYEYLDIGKVEKVDERTHDVVTTDKCGIKGPLDSNNQVDWGKASGKIGLAVVDILLRIAGLVSVVFVIFGGIKLTISEGEPEKFKQAKETVFNALIGLVIVLSATAAVNFVGNTLK